MLACARTFALDGLTAAPVSVEVDVRPGLPAFRIVGLGDASVRESRERVQAAIVNSGLEFPARRITANLAPAYLPKVGAGFDLALACALLAATGQVPCGALERHALFGELSLGGQVRPSQGTLAVAHAARRAGLETLVVARERTQEAALVDGLKVAGVEDLRGAAAVLHGERASEEGRRATAAADRRSAQGDLADVRGQEGATDGALVAAAGGHNLLMSGPPGVGKTMLAWRIPSILPRLSGSEAVEVTRIHSLASRAGPQQLMRERPFRAPHHSVSAAGLIGGSNPRLPGEAVLAHHGVLFLDELSEFSRGALEALRQPLEDGRVVIVRAQHVAVQPARFMLVAATNPCPCGLGTDDTRCSCGEADLARHRRRLSGALLDRIDVLVALERPSSEQLRRPGRISSAEAREAVMAARERQASRAGREGATNARLEVGLLRRHARLDDRGERVLATAHQRGALSARAHDRVLRVARTIADLASSERVGAEHVLKALSLRHEVGVAPERVA